MGEGAKTSQVVHCDICKKQYKNHAKLKEHKRKVHNGNFYCDLCDAKFAAVSSLTTHKRTKHEGLQFPCIECNHKASQKGDLKRHMQSKHSEKRPTRRYKKSFKSKVANINTETTT